MNHLPKVHNKATSECFFEEPFFPHQKQNSKRRNTHPKKRVYAFSTRFGVGGPRLKEEFDLGSVLATGTAKRPEVPGAEKI